MGFNSKKRKIKNKFLKLAKSNIKNINNNSITQSTSSPIFSKNSYIYYTYIYLNFLFFFRFFFLSKSFYFVADFLLPKFENKKKTLINRYKLFFFKNYNVNKFTRLSYNILIKVFYYNGLITHIYDFILLKKYTNKFKEKIEKKKINIVVITNKINIIYKLLKKLIDKYF